jgi:predicted RNA binding protein YcfA (HicA-like mRNA interferase family)
MVFKPMRRRDVVAILAEYGCRPLRNVGGHEIYACPCGEHRTAVPNHKKVTAGVVASIGNQVACLPKGWLQ